jgi:cbb3-type cytochrome c oxidase subunit III
MKQLSLLLILTVGSTAILSAQTNDHPGAAVYMNYCSACHGKNLEGGQAPSLLTTKWKQGESKKAVAQTIKKGVANTPMMAWENMLTDKQIEQVADYMLSLKKKKKEKST